MFFLLFLVLLFPKHIPGEMTGSVADYLISRCRIGPEIIFPGDSTGEVTNVSIAIIPFRLMGIFDVTETFGMTLSVVVQWSDQCVKNALQNPDFQFKNFSSFTFDQDRLWNPKVLHLNSRYVKPLRGGDFERSTVLQSEGIILTYYYGYFESSCDLKLQNFPFDT